MLKNKFKIIAILIVLILSIMTPFVSAVDAEDARTTTSEEGIEATSENSEEGVEAISEESEEHNHESEEVVDEEESFKKSDIYLTGDNVTIDYIIDGNLFVIADTVTINAQIGGDAFICANTLVVEEDGYIFSNLFTISENIEIKGVVYDLYALSQDTTISGYVYRDVKIATGNLNVYGNIGRNAFVDCSTLSLEKTEGDTTTAKGAITGDLNYTSPTEISIPDGSVAGKTNYTKSTETTSSFNLNDSLVTLGTVAATAIIIWLLCLWLAPKFLKRTGNLIASKKVLPVLGLGIATPIVLAIAMIVLLIIGITSTIGLLALILLIVLIMLANSIFIISINNVVCKKLKIEKTIAVLGMLVVCSIVLWAVTLIPYVGGLVGFIAGVLGLGIIVYSIIFKEKEEITENVA